MRIPEFLAQIAVESSRLSRLQEDLTYKTPERLMAVWPRRFYSREVAMPFVNNPHGLAELVYGNRMGNFAPGDGWKYRGRGLKQLTGKTNYKAYQDDSNVSVVERPDLLLDPVYAADSAGWFWYANKCDYIADDTHELTRKINGGLTMLAERIAMTAAARSALA
jgi:putative chitinase